MIYYFVTRQAAYTMDIHKASWAGELRHRIQVVYYDQLIHYRKLPGATFIFTDYERLSPAQRELTVTLWNALKLSGQAVRLLNHPEKVAGREALLRKLHGSGRNPFAVYRLDEDLSAVRYPAFLRQDSGHAGSLSSLLNNPAELARAVDALIPGGISRQELLLIEFCDTADSSGVFRKYSAFRVGDRVIARHLLVSKRWMLKSPDIVDAAALAEEQAYLATHPHQRELEEIFELSGIDYGRIDYSILDGRVVTWEINTNPMIGIEPWQVAADRLPMQSRFVRQFNDALVANEVDSNGQLIPLRLTKELLRKLGARRRDRVLRTIGMTLRRLGRTWPWRAVLQAAS